MMHTTNPEDQGHLPHTPSQTVRQRWLDLLDLSYSNRCVTQQEIEPGVHAIVVPARCRRESNRDLIEVERRVASGRVPAMAHGVRLDMERLGEFALAIPANYHGWMGVAGQDVAAGKTQVTAFVDLAYLEGALLARLWDCGVLVEFGSPLAFFRRGALIDYANVHEAVAMMLAAGRSLADAADLLAAGVRSRLQFYAHTYHRLSSLYAQAAWHIDRDNFVVRVPPSELSISLQYWELRLDAAEAQKVLHGWRQRLEELLQPAATSANRLFPRSYAA
jgi:hypothetical protein